MAQHNRILYILTTMFLCCLATLLGMVSAETYYVTPNSSVSCPRKPCQNLTQYAAEPRDYFTAATTLILLPGQHLLQKTLLIENINSLKVYGNASSLNADIICNDRSVNLTFTNIDTVHMHGIVLVACGGNTIASVDQLTVEDCNLQGRGIASIAMVLDNVHHADIVATVFVSFTGGDIQTAAGVMHGGGAITAYSSNVSIAKCLFQNNSVVIIQFPPKFESQIGGAVYSKNSTFLIINTLFNANAAGKGGMAYLEGGSNWLMGNITCTGNFGFIFAGVAFTSSSNLSITASSFSDNSAADAGGVVFMDNNSLVIFDNSTFLSNKKHFLKWLETHIDSGAVAYLQGGSTLILHHSHFINNTNFEGDPSGGGAITAFESSVIYTQGCMYSNNLAQSLGGTFIMVNSGLESTDDSFINTGEFINGTTNKMVLLGSGSQIAITRGTFHNNKALVFLAFYCTIEISDSTFTDNVALNTTGIYASIMYLNTTVVHMTDCTFRGNTAINGGAVLTVNSQLTAKNCTFVGNEAVTLEGYIGGGGAVMAALNSRVVADRCRFEDNAAQLGGAVYVFTGSTLSTQDSHFYNNSASIAGGGVFCSGPHSSGVTMTDTVFEYNSARNGGILATTGLCRVFSNGSLDIQRNKGEYLGTIYLVQSEATIMGDIRVSENQGSLLAVASTVTFNGEVSFTNNTSEENKISRNYQEGGALTAFQSTLILNGQTTFTGNEAQNGGAVMIRESKLLSYGRLIVTNNRGYLTGGGINAYQSDITFYEDSTGEIRGNSATDKGGGVHAIGATITLSNTSSLFFIENNVERDGGGVYMEQNSKIYISKEVIEKFDCSQSSPLPCNSDPEKWLFLSFAGNHARRGGAVFVNDGNSGTCDSTLEYQDTEATDCFIQVLALYMNPGTMEYLSGLHQRNTKFSNNTAAEAGEDIFGGLLDRCTVGLFSEQLLLQPDTHQSSPYYIFNITDIKNSSISSGSVRVCFCRDGEADCSYQPPVQHVMKGHMMTMSVAAVDQVNHTLPSTIHSSLHSGQGGLGEGQASQNTSHTCTELQYNVVSPLDGETVLLNAAGPCNNVGISQNSFQVVFENCTCPIGFEPKLSNPSSCDCECDSSITPYVLNCTYGNDTLLRNTDSWMAFVNTTEDEGIIVYPNCPFDYCYPATKLVYVNLNVPNGADAQCAFNRTGILCGSCPEGLSLTLGTSRCAACSNSWLSLLIPFSLAGIALVAFILAFNLTVDVGTLNGLIFYANVVTAFHDIFLPFDKPNFMTVFISWLNLDFGIETCFYDGLDGYANTWLQLAFPLYIVLLITIVIMIGRYTTSPRIQQLIHRGKPIITLSTLILLLYTKLLRVIIAALSFARLEYPDGSIHMVWLYDANVPYLRGKHIPLFIAAVFILIVGSAYTLLLFSWQWLVGCPDNLFIRKWIKNYITALIDPYHAPHRHGPKEEDNKHRYWTGLLLLLRILLYLIAAANVQRDPRINLLSINSILVGLFVLELFIVVYHTQGIYKHWCLDVLESSFFLNLIVFAGVMFYIIESKKDQAEIVAYMSTSIAFVTFLGIIAFHAYKFILKGNITRCIRNRNHRIHYYPPREESDQYNNASPLDVHSHDASVSQYSLDPPSRGESSSVFIQSGLVPVLSLGEDQEERDVGDQSKNGKTGVHAKKESTPLLK